MFKKIAVALVMVAVLAFAAPAHAQAVTPTPPPVLVAGPAGGAALLPFSVALGVAAFVIYADAEGIEFPLCDFNGWKCTYSYPGDSQ